MGFRAGNALDSCSGRGFTGLGSGVPGPRGGPFLRGAAVPPTDEPVPAGDVRWAFAVVGDATHLSDQLDETLDVVAGALEASGDVFRPGEFAWALAGDVRACFRCDVTGEARVDGGRQSDALSVTVKPAPAPATFPGDAAYRLRIVGDGRAWLAGDPDDRRRLARTFAAVRDRFPVATATTDGGERAAALLE